MSTFKFLTHHLIHRPLRVVVRSLPVQAPLIDWLVVKLLVSVASSGEAAAACAGGVDVVDAKDPTAGALGPVTLRVLGGIYATCGGAVPVTAALGDATTESAVERVACTFAAAGTAFIKLGFAGCASATRLESLVRAAVNGSAMGCRRERARVVAVAYADAHRVGSLAPDEIVDGAARGGAAGLLLDTACKDEPSLPDLLAPATVNAWVNRVHDAGLFAALAGRLTLEDLPWVYMAGADIVGVRGAACQGGRTGRVTSDRVRALHTLCSALNGERAVVPG